MLQKMLSLQPTLLWRLQDKIQGFWDITKSRLEDKADELAAKDQEIESLQEKHYVEVKVHCNMLSNISPGPAAMHSLLLINPNHRICNRSSGPHSKVLITGCAESTHR